MKKYRRKRKTEVPLTADQKAEKQALRYKKRLKAKKRKRTLYLCVILLIIIVAIMIFTPVFNISKIEVKGNSNVPTEEIIQTGRIFTGDNIWLFKKGRAEKLIAEIPYIDSVEVSRAVPNKIKVIVKESKQYGYVQNGKDNYLLIDRNGKILEQVKKPSDKLKEIKVSKVLNTKVGELFVEEGTFADKAYKLILEKLDKNGYEDSTNSITIKSDDISFKYNELVVIVGDTSQLDYKFAFFKTFLKERGDDVEGCFDISAPDVGGYYNENYDENAPIVIKSEEDAENEDGEEGENDSGEQTEE